MPYYGPWIQVPDQEVTPASFVGFYRTVDGDEVTTEPDPENPPVVYGVDTTTTVTDGDEIPVDLPHVSGYWLEAQGALVETIGSDVGVPAFPTFTASHANTRGLPTEEDPTRWFDSHSFTRGVSGDLFHTTVADITWHDAWRASLPPEEQWPEGAVSYEVEEREFDGVLQPVAEVLRADVRIHGTGRSQEGYMSPVEMLVIFRDLWLTEHETRLEYAADTNPDLYGYLSHERVGILAGDPNADREYLVDEVVSVDISAGDIEAVGPGLVAPLSMWSCIRFPPDSMGSLVVVHDDGYVPNGTTTIDFNRAEDTAPVTYIVRPPRIRWIYDTPPYRRTYPRDDGLAGGAPRTWPPSRAILSSNRTYGGYL